MRIFLALLATALFSSKAFPCSPLPYPINVGTSDGVIKYKYQTADRVVLGRVKEISINDIAKIIVEKRYKGPDQPVVVMNNGVCGIVNLKVGDVYIFYLGDIEDGVTQAFTGWSTRASVPPNMEQQVLDEIAH